MLPVDNTDIASAAGDNFHGRLPFRPHGRSATRRLDVQNFMRGPWRLMALYEAGRISGALRYSTDRDPEVGLDGWGTSRTFEFLQTHSDLVFNDLSKEHGGFWEDHTSHQRGRSIDVRYFGTGGDSNHLNGAAGEGDQGTYRRTRLLAAQNGNVTAQREIVAWIRQNRQRMDQLFTDPRLNFIYVGQLAWNWNSLVGGLYPNGDPVEDPDLPPGTGALGNWTTPAGKLRKWPNHLSHAHIEILKQ